MHTPCSSLNHSEVRSNKLVTLQTEQGRATTGGKKAGNSAVTFSGSCLQTQDKSMIPVGKEVRQCHLVALVSAVCSQGFQ